jgi:FtsP/CotA-like multicopper oxidase with cupredoxin domain
MGATPMRLFRNAMEIVMLTRREMLSAAALVGGAALLQGPQALAADAATSPIDYTPVHTPNGLSLPFKTIDGVKVFHLIAEEIEHEFMPGLKSHCWGYNGRTTGPTIEAVEGDRVRIYVTNRLPEATTVHWHGIRVPNGMDGVNGLTQPGIPPGETFRYEFDLPNAGTYMYHPHLDEMTQQGMGMMGMFVVHARVGQRVDRDYCIMLSEWRIIPGTSRPVTTEMVDFNLLTMNSKTYPATEPLVAQLGERVRIRFGNLSAMDHHPIHLHGFQMFITETDGGIVPPGARYPTNTVLVPVGATRAVEFVADNPGDWPMHCHMTHHTMNQMGHDVPNVLGIKTQGLGKQVKPMLPGFMAMAENGMDDAMQMQQLPNSVSMTGGKGQFGPIDMGGMFTVVKVRKQLSGYDDPGDYAFPPGTLASKATAAELDRDGIDVTLKAKS